MIETEENKLNAPAEITFMTKNCEFSDLRLKIDKWLVTERLNVILTQSKARGIIHAVSFRK